MGEILVTTPETTQSFLLYPHELHGARYRFRQRVQQFHEIMAAEQVAERAAQLAIAPPQLQLMSA
jgi:hypothetical protein